MLLTQTTFFERKQHQTLVCLKNVSGGNIGTFAVGMCLTLFVSFQPYVICLSWIHTAKQGSASSAHTDLAHLRTHILLALAPHLRTQI